MRGTVVVVFLGMSLVQASPARADGARGSTVALPAARFPYPPALTQVDAGPHEARDPEIAQARNALVREPERRWYGGYTLAVDAINAATGIFFVGIGGYFVAAPIVHLVHHEPIRAAVSVSLRVALPLAGYGLTCRQNACKDIEESGGNGPGRSFGIVIGVGAGALLAMLIDAAALSYTSTIHQPPAASMVPLLSIEPSGARFGFASTF